MQKIYLFLLMLPIFAVAQTKPIDAQQLRFNAMTQMDTVQLEKILHEDLQYAHSNGLIESKKDFIQSVALQKIKYEKIEPIESKVEKYGKTAIITGFCKVNGKFNNIAFEVKLRYLSVYRKKNGRWLLKSWQSLKIDK